MTTMKLMDKYEAVKTLLSGGTVENFTVADAMEFMDERKALIAKKNASGGERKPTKEQIANEGIKQTIVSVLSTASAPTTIRDMQKLDESLSGYSGQKLTALVSQLVKSGVLARTEVKGKAYFAIASTEEA